MEKKKQIAADKYFRKWSVVPILKDVTRVGKNEHELNNTKSHLAGSASQTKKENRNKMSVLLRRFVHLKAIDLSLTDLITSPI